MFSDINPLFEFNKGISRDILLGCVYVHPALTWQYLVNIHEMPCFGKIKRQKNSKLKQIYLYLPKNSYSPFQERLFKMHYF